MNETPLERLTLERFAAQVKTPFRLHREAGGEVELELTEAAAIRSPALPRAAGESPRQERFSLLFHGPEQAFLPQGLYRLEHASLGMFTLFLVPVGRAAGTVHYEAVFNRLAR